MDARQLARGLRVLCLTGLAISLPAGAQELLTNGDFESGAFAPWVVTDLAGGSGTFHIDAPGTTTPIGGFATSPGTGASYAVSDQSGPGTHVLIQSFVVPALGAGDTVTLSFDMFVKDQSGIGPINNAVGLDHTMGANQHSRVDVLTGAATPFDTGAGVLGNFYLGVDPGPTPNPYTPYSANITGIVSAGGTFQVRFGEVDNQLFQHLGVDNVSVLLTPGIVAPTMSPMALAALLLLLFVAGGMLLKRRERSS